MKTHLRFQRDSSHIIITLFETSTYSTANLNFRLLKNISTNFLHFTLSSKAFLWPFPTLSIYTTFAASTSERWVFQNFNEKVLISPCMSDCLDENPVTRFTLYLWDALSRSHYQIQFLRENSEEILQRKPTWLFLRTHSTAVHIQGG